MVAAIVRERVRAWRLAAACACVVLAACGGHSSMMSPSPVIACPSAAPVTSLDGTPQPVSFSTPIVTGGQAPVTTTCTPASGSAFPVGQNTVSCAAADAKGRNAVCTFIIVVQPPPTLDVTSFLAFGDSITWGEDGRDTAFVQGRRPEVQLEGETYPEDLEKELQARYVQQLPTVTNCGSPGEDLRDPTTVDRYLAQAASRRFGSVLIMEGSNDVNDAVGDSHDLGEAIGNLQLLVDDAKSRGMQAFIATVPPMVPPGIPERTKGYLLVPSYNDMVKALAGSEGVPLVDVYAAFGPDAPSLIGFDGLHPNAAGYQRIADTFFTAIKTVLEPSTMRLTRGRHIAATGGECAGLP